MIWQAAEEHLQFQSVRPAIAVESGNFQLSSNVEEE